MNVLNFVENVEEYKKLTLNQLDGILARYIVSGRSPASSSFILFEFRKNSSQSCRVGKSDFASAARTFNGSKKPITFNV